MKKRGFFLLLIVGCGILVFLGIRSLFNTPVHLIPEVHTPPKIEEDPPETKEKLKSIDAAAPEIFFIWEKGFLLKNIHTSEEFIDEFNLELKSRFEQTFSIFKECGAPLEMAVSSAFPLQSLSPEIFPKYLIYLEQIHRFLILNWKTVESIHLFLIQTVESANRKGFLVRYEKFAVLFQSFQNSLRLKEATYTRFYDYCYFLDQVVDAWKFDGKRIWVDPPELQLPFEAITIDLYYALQKAQSGGVLPPELQLGIRLDETDYWKGKQSSIQKIQAGQLSQPYDYIELFRNYYWSPEQNFTIPPEIDRKEYLQFAIALYEQSLKKLEEPLAQKLLQAWDPLLFEPILYRKKEKSFRLAKKQLVSALWFYFCQYQAS
ncbi:MAG: hypothetical protein AABZ60_01470, partial [Planctomycetota bacterium]